MKKLFDIPIYALSPDELSHRVKQKIDKLKEYAAGTDPQTMDLIIDNETFPKRCWEYNHIVGYIRISATRRISYLICSCQSLRWNGISGILLGKPFSTMSMPTVRIFI